MPPLTLEERAALDSELGQITGLTLDGWNDLQALPKPQRDEILEGWRSLDKLSWTKDTTVLDRVREILQILSDVASPAAVVLGAVQGLEGVIAAARGL